MNIPLQLSTINERLGLALESTRQVAFDWHIRGDKLYFSGELANGLKNVPLDTSKVWSTSALPALIHDEDRGRFQKRLHNALKGNGCEDSGFYRVELRLKDAIRGWRWVDISGKIVQRDSCGRAIRMVGTFSDIDERKRAETKTERLRDLYAALSQINQAIMRFSGRDALFREICRIAVEHGPFRAAWIGLVDDQTQLVLPVAGHGCGLDVLNALAIPIEKSKLQGHGAIDTGAGDNRPTGRNTLTLRDRRETVTRSDSEDESIASFPFRLPGQEVGVLHLHAMDKDFFDASLIDLLKEMTTNLSFAIDSHAREMQRQLVELSPEAIFVYRDTGLALANQAAMRLLGAEDAAALLGRSILDFVCPDHHALFRERVRMQPQDQSSTPFVEQLWSRLDGARFHVEIAATNLMYDGEPAVQVVARDITQRKRSEAIQLGQNRILNMVATGAALADILTEIAQFAESQSDRGLCAIQQLDSDGKTLGSSIAPSLPITCLAQIDATRLGPGNGSCSAAVTRSEPVIVTDIASDPLWSNLRKPALAHDLKACSSWPIFGRNRKIIGAFSFYFREPVAPAVQDFQLFDICANLAGIAIESRTSEEKIRYLAHYDGLTSLPNRFLFNEYLDLALRNAQRHASKFAVFFLDLDKFKEVNDTLGHAAGDQVLREIAARLRNCLRHTDKIARMGGDEFYVLIEELSDGRYAADVALKLLDAASRPVHVGGQNCRLSASIGIAIYPDNGDDGQTLLKNADGAMYRAKDTGKNAYRFYSVEDAHDVEQASPFKPSFLSQQQENELTRAN